MPKFLDRSLERLNTCHADLQMIMQYAIQVVDFSVVCGHRGKDEQTKALLSGASKTEWPNSKHNSYLSQAIDIAPFPYNASPTPKNLARYYFLAGVVMTVAGELKIPLRWGGDWADTINAGPKRPDFTKNRFDDLFHFELMDAISVPIKRIA